MLDILRKHPIVAILRNIPNEILLDYANAAWQGGIRCFEVAMNTPLAASQIRSLVDELPADALVGAGTAFRPDIADQAIGAGARFLLTPSINAEILAHCREKNYRLLPGVMTPSDVDLCLGYGYTVMKLFPAGDLPLSYVKSLKGPFDGTEYVAVGGVSLDNAGDFLRAGYIGVGIGSNLIPRELVERRDWAKAQEAIGEMLFRASAV